MSKRQIVLESFEFTEKDPDFTPRTPYSWMSEDELNSIAKYPYSLDENCPFCALFKVDGQAVTLRGVVPAGFTYNLADIPWFVEPISYDKHSPFVKNASFMHDYLVSHKKDLYLLWNLKDKGVTPIEFKKMTSIVFCHILKQNAVPYSKAQLMAFFVDLWQYCIPGWYSLGKTETTL